MANNDHEHMNHVGKSRDKGSVLMVSLCLLIVASIVLEHLLYR